MLLMAQLKTQRPRSSRHVMTWAVEVKPGWSTAVAQPGEAKSDPLRRAWLSHILRQYAARGQYMNKDKTSLRELIWLNRLKQAPLLDAKSPQDAFLRDYPTHTPRLCANCIEGPCALAQRGLELGLGTTWYASTPVS